MTTVPYSQAKPGDLVFHPFTWGNPLEMLMYPKSPHFGHVGVYAGNGWEIAANGQGGWKTPVNQGLRANGGVIYEEAGDAGAIVVPMLLNGPGLLANAIKRLYIGYDYFAWVLALFGVRGGVLMNGPYTCSSLIGDIWWAVTGDTTLDYRSVTPDDCARKFGLLE